MTLGKRLCMVIIQVSQETALQVDTIVELEDGLEVAVLFFGDTEDDCMFIVCVSQEIELKSLEFYLEDGFEQAICC